jgi:peptide/nickel transport system permease protein
MKNRLLQQFGAEFNLNLVIGLIMLLVVVIYGLLGPMLIPEEMAQVGSASPRLQPGDEGHLLGTDTQGRDVFAMLTYATPQTLKIGLIAGGVGIFVGTLLGILAGYFGGGVDNVIRVLTDVFITIPGMAIMIVIATNTRSMTVLLIALIVSLLAWRFPTRTIRAQTLSLRERPYVQIARLNGMNEIEIVFKEVLPNLLPYIAASFVLAVSSSILMTIGLEALGLGPQNEYTLGMMIYWSNFYGAILRGMWWWWFPPIVLIVWIFVSLLFVSAGMDQIVNTKLRSQA